MNLKPQSMPSTSLLMLSFLVISVALLSPSASALDWFSIKTHSQVKTMTPTLTPTLTPTPTPTPTPTSSTDLCTVPLPSTTLACETSDTACSKCGKNQICVQVGKENDSNYACPQFECQNCPEPVCNPTCGCKEECVIEHNPNCNVCPTAHCRPLPVCLDCPELSCDAVKCDEHSECKVTPNTCNACGKVECVPKPCLECPTEPPTCFCPRGKTCKTIPGSCYECQKTVCEDIPDPCKDCKGECSVSENPNCHNCPPLRNCVENCQQCSPYLPNWSCENPTNAIYISRTCSTCARYVCSEGSERFDGY